MSKKLYFLWASFLLFSGAIAQPVVPAADPTASSADVISVYSDVFTNLSGTDFFPNWSQSTVVSDFPIGSNNTKKLVNFNYQGIQFSSPINASSMEKLHIDIWSTNCTVFDLYLINTTPGTVEQKVSLTLNNTGWNSFDIPLSSYNNINLANIGQMKLVSTPFGGTTVYYDNLYFWKAANTPVLSNFSIPAQLVGSAPFTLTPPTSNSSGAFTYTSSNTNVATISGNTINIIGAGTSIITANQAAAGIYGPGSITAQLVVTYPGPSTAAPNPTATSTDVISVYSDVYTNVTSNLNPFWGQSTAVTDFTIGSNTMKKMDNLNYQGIELGSSINATTMQNLHIDIWTPNCTTFDLYLINLGPTVEQKVSLTPNNTGWNSFDIPLSSFNNINLANIGQFKFVSTPFGGTTVYYDNLYFWRAPNAPTLSNFNIAPQVLGTAPFTITPPTSNSTGAFSYNSGNTNVATISGNTITIVGVGTSLITATQAAAGSYGQGVITTTLVVSYPPPMTPAPIPTISSNNVFSLYSDTYTNLGGINWNPNWGQSTSVNDILITGNTTRKYDFMNYQGVEFASPIDVSTYDKLHLDIWTPNCTSFKVFLINLGPTVEQFVTLTPNNTGWNSFDIDLSLFRNTTTVNLSAIAQMKFEAIPFGSSTVYMDNLYFYKNIGLPISLTHFTAKSNKNTVQLNWTTLNEFNNKGFMMERSTDGVNFNVIGNFVNGKGNSSTPSQYQLLDVAPKVGNNYYRFKQIDFDGRFSYSPIVSVKINKNDLLGFSFYPNPIKDILKINVGLLNNNNATLKIVNSVGQIIFTKEINKINTSSIIDINISKFKKGTYFIQLIDGLNKTVEKIVVN